MRVRANIHLDADAYDFASAYAHGRGLPLGTAVSELLRRAEQQIGQPMGESSRMEMSPDGYLVLKANGQTITPEMVKLSSEDDPV
jgi:hypothetical protein